MNRKTLLRIILVLFLVGSIISLDIVRQGKIGRRKDELSLHILYTSEKKGWIDSVTPFFSEWYEERNPGKHIRLIFEVLGTRSSMISILAGESKPAIWSPAASVWVPLFEWYWEKKFGNSFLNSSDVQSLVASPIVLGTWKSYIQSENISALADLYDLADKGLKLAHTSAQESNSGFMAVLLEVVAATGKTPDKITLEDFQNVTVQNWLEKVESTAVLYGTSTGFLAKQAVQLGPSGLNVIIVYENLIIETAKDGEAQAKWNDSLVAVYPEEGTFWSDHPLVKFSDADWVSEEEAYAADEFEEFLLSKEIQQMAIPFGFRPGNQSLLEDEDIQNELNEVFKPEYGVQINLTIPQFSPPSDGEILDRIPDLWLKTRATSLEDSGDSEYYQLGNELVALPILLTMVLLSVIYKKKRKRRSIS
ncbi:MAG: substrate-binding domain-containing protein [Candidatus Heimdallarchaeota archaeon]|nr:substrate-binding domain-containing protein [Candidatus Heimdallarchaeota archaeon]MCK4876014.1 substrate-binding domain-containing protein [Candidatus Heimdallarchaeota archaeon]